MQVYVCTHGQHQVQQMIMELEPDEPAAGPWRAMPVSDLVDRLHAAAGDHRGRPRIVAVDGRGGAGKTTLVTRLQAHVPDSAVVHTDDVAWHHAYFDWGGLLAEHVLEPLRRGAAVDYRPTAWAERDRPGSITVPAGLDTVFVEGTGVVRAALAPLLDASVWIQVDRSEAARRLLDRDGDAPAQRRHMEAWDIEERPFLLAEQPWHHATLVVAGSPILENASTTHVAVAATRSSQTALG